MSNLAIIERYDFKNLSPKLTKSQVEIITARNSETVKSLIAKNEPLFYAEIMKVFDLAFMLVGHKKGDDYKARLIAASKALSKNFTTGLYGSLTVNELTIAVERGCSGQYGEFMGINYVTINKFILGYVQEMNEAITKQRIYEGDLKFKRDQKEKAERLKREYEESFEGLVDADINFKKSNPTAIVQDLGGVKFKRLRNEGKIEFTVEQVEKLKERTILAYERQVSEARKEIVKKRAATSGDRIKPEWRVDSEENEKAAKNRIYCLLGYNEYLKLS
jgi:hypothetical protein